MLVVSYIIYNVQLRLASGWSFLWFASDKASVYSVFLSFHSATCNRTDWLIIVELELQKTLTEY